ncbi:hypothetical protein [Picosynechococcus sp. PCC 11901]|uniref:hypothetical protein n=1 Tax=Picosynechococcus sp. PCC 11901 TaxID=2579791 RepID=UPI0030DA6A3F
MQAVTADGMEDDQALAIAAALENPSEHPLAKAIVGAAKDDQLQLPRCKIFKRLLDGECKASLRVKPIM